MMINLENLNVILKREIAVNCRTKEEAIEFIKLSREFGLNNNIEFDAWDENLENTCFDINNDEYFVSFSNTEYYLKHGYEVISFSDFENIEKSDKKIFSIKSPTKGFIEILKQNICNKEPLVVKIPSHTNPIVLDSIIEVVTSAAKEAIKDDKFDIINISFIKEK